MVGAIAALVHYLVAVGLESLTALEPSVANVAGFCCAFPVSYFGHRQWSFANHRAPHRSAFPKFFLIAVLGFLANQILVLLSMQLTTVPFWLTLGVVMVIIAASTYLLSRYWAFAA
jgi:putative flippase GtrA